MSPPDWLIQKISALQSLGFFYESEPILIAEKLIQASEESYFGPVTHLRNEPYLDLILLSMLDPAVWMIEDYLVLGQTDAFKDNFYPRVLQKLSSISGGKFQPKSIQVEECGYCEGRDKRVFLLFELESEAGVEEAKALNFCIDGSGLVMDFFAELNEMLAATGFAYKALRDPYGLCFVLFVSKNQADALQQDREWEWADFSPYWFERARFAREQEEVETAKFYFEKARNGAFNPAVYSEYASCLEQGDEFDEALELYTEVIAKMNEIADPSIRDNWWLKYFNKRYEIMR